MLLEYGQLQYNFDEVGVTFLAFQNMLAQTETDIYQIPQFPLETWTNSLGFETLSIKDIAWLKAFARTRRSKMKDIVDIAEVLHHEISLPQILYIAESQFGHDISKKEILTTLLELDDILANPMDEEIQYIHHRQYHRQLDIWIFGYLDICFGNGAKRISRNSYIGFGKSYLIPETTNFDIGEGIAS